QFQDLIKLTGLKIFEEIIDGIQELPVLHHLIMHVGSSGGACTAYGADLVSPFDFLPYPDGKVIHVRIPGSKAKPMVDDDRFAITAKFSFDLLDHPVACCVYGCALGGGEVNPGMHLPYFEDGVKPHAIA